MAFLVYVIVSVTTLIVYRFILQPALFSPLASIPAAHWSARFCNLWILWARYQRRESHSIHAAHVKLGPLVRLGPNEIAVNDLKSLKTVYLGGWEKPEWYLLFTNYWGIPNMFTMLRSADHSRRKRQLSNIYAKSFLQRAPTMQSTLQSVIQGRFMGIVAQAAKAAEPVEVYNLLSRMAMDVMSNYMFGIRSGTNMLHDVEAFDKLMRVYVERGKHAFVHQEMPILLGPAKSFALPPYTTEVENARNQVDKFCIELCERVEKQIQSGLLNDNEAVVFRQLTKYDKDETLHSTGTSKAVASELLDHLLAGFETTATALTYALYRLSTRKDVQDMLRDELRSLKPPFSTNKANPLPLPTEVDRLPFLNAILMETLRLNASIPGPQPRISPAGAFLGEYGPLPAGIRVSAQAYSLHRNEEIFPDPEKWDPQRWMQSEHSAEMTRWFWAFSSGGRMCIGSNLAMLESKMVLAAIYTSYATDVEDASGIEQEDAYTAGPSGDVFLSFREVTA